jgi:hypothetical protein
MYWLARISEERAAYSRGLSVEDYRIQRENLVLEKKLYRIKTKQKTLKKKMNKEFRFVFKYYNKIEPLNLYEKANISRHPIPCKFAFSKAKERMLPPGNTL